MPDAELTKPDLVAADSADDFDSALEAAVADAYPVLRERVESAQFAGWHRRRGRQEDLAHEAAARLIRHCRKHRRLPTNVLGYLVATARNLAKKQYATRALDPIEEAQSTFPTLLNPRSSPDHSDEEDTRLRSRSSFELVLAGIQMLPKRQRAALELYLREPGAPHRELGQKMGIGEDGFQKNLNRGVRRLREMLEKQDLMGTGAEE